MGKNILVLIVFGAVVNAFGMYQTCDCSYDWGSEYQGGNFTTQVWTFDDNGYLPNTALDSDVDNNDNGTAQAFVDYSNIGLFSGGWDALNWEGKDGVYYDPQNIGITLTIPNYDIPNPLKVIVLKVSYREAEFANAVVNSAGDARMISSDVEIGADGWNVLTAIWEVRPNPTEETIQFDLVSTGTAAVDCISVHTVCVPEPATLSLLVLGGLFVAKRRK